MFLAVPPTKAELVGYEAEEELVVREEEEVELVCRVHNARPRPDIIWYRGGEEFVSGEHHFPFFISWVHPHIAQVHPIFSY